jgi:hypothetical protein
VLRDDTTCGHPGPSKANGLCSACYQATPERREYRRGWKDTNRDRIREQAREYYLANKDVIDARNDAYYKANPDAAWARQLRRRFGMTVDDYNAMVRAQHGVCAVCRQSPNGNHLCVDHDHRTGLIRGLLCDACNGGIGQFDDDVQLLASAAEYLHAFPATRR